MECPNLVFYGSQVGRFDTVLGTCSNCMGSDPQRGALPYMHLCKCVGYMSGPGVVLLLSRFTWLVSITVLIYEHMYMFSLDRVGICVSITLCTMSPALFSGDI